ncbi:hypothetical protein K470DRAFT_276383 [Piedraia hortae CBS 480.64]|uniref:CID domain-containing protein n=1 Tax=Piedraia hortae CBS 480.64 TaxID=1314780 RepID=A0A6A7C0Z1_9PEZI|nr:hypothetical protein K470DRAFT_276383 [Piedraia hortae CBS 480.64]
MAALSPRGSLSAASDVATDFEESLKDLQQNNRLEIMNLTTIARENTEHAHAFSRILENHIKKVTPSRKLPALYLLDSIVKNVGTPYTVFLSRNLYSTFMEAYTLVDNATRRAMDNLLKTWKEPVPGSVDHRPVFQPEVVRPIENALIKAKTMAVQHQRQGPLYSNHSTPVPYNSTTPVPFNTTPTPFTPYHGAVSTPPPRPSSVISSTPQPVIDYKSLRSDVDALVVALQAQLATSPYDADLRSKYENIFQLQRLVNAGDIPPASFQNVRTEISKVAASLLQKTQAVSAWPSAPYLFPPTQPEPIPNLQDLLNQKPATIHLPVPQQTPAPDAKSLLAALTQSGVLPQPTPTPTPNVGSLLSQLQPQQSSTAEILASLEKILPRSGSQTGMQSIPPSGPPGVPLSGMPQLPPQGIPPTASQPMNPRSISLRTPRPDLLQKLYTSQPNQCSACGRRFTASPEGKAEKARHLDWHFRANQALATADPTTRHNHRNWHPTEMQWIKHLDFDHTTSVAEISTTKAKDGGEGYPQGDAKGGYAKTDGKDPTHPKANKGEDKHVRAPPGVSVNVCAICQEEMRSRYDEGVGDWVFGNAAFMGTAGAPSSHPIVHWTCLREVSGRGKRKGEGEESDRERRRVRT